MATDQSSIAPKIIAQAPCRVDLAGGTLDLWPLYLFHPGAVTVNFAVSVPTRCKITRLDNAGADAGQIRLVSLDGGLREEYSSLEELRAAPKPKHALAAHLVKFFAPQCGIEIETDSQSPAGAGISGSSALMIATTAALAHLTGRKIELEKIREIAQNVEAQLIQVPTGCQDYYPALYGGVSAIHLAPDGIHRQAIEVDADELDRRFVLAYTGAPRQSGINNWKVFQAHIDGDGKVFRNFERIGEIARALHQALSQANWPEVARLLGEEWKLRKTNAPRITTPVIEKLIKVACRHGALAAKVCGAGGGGCVVFLCEPEARKRVAAAIAGHGGKVLPARVAREGLKISEGSA